MSTSERYYNKFLFSREFDICKSSDSISVMNAAQDLCDEFSYKTDNAVKTCKVILCNLIIIHTISEHMYLAIGLSHNDYKKSRYNPSQIGCEAVIKLVDHLDKEDYVKRQGHYFNCDFSSGYCTRLKPTTKLIALFCKYGLKPEMVKDHPNKEVLVRKGKTVKGVRRQKGLDGKVKTTKANEAPLDDYRETDSTKRMRGAIRQYNDLLLRTYIDVDEYGYAPDNGRKEDIVIDLANKTTRRIFNNGSFSQGGRYYGGWWQSIPSDLRKRIIINGHNIVEIDFSGMHIHIFYATKGLKLEKEPYVVSKDNDPLGLRPVYKQIMLVAINCNSDDECISAAYDKVLKNRDKYSIYVKDNVSEIFIRKLLRRLKEHHSAIADCINGEIGLKAQYIDSEIASEVIKTMTIANIPVLCIHDSFICEYAYENELRNAMANAYIEVVSKMANKRLKHNLVLNVDDVKNKIDTIVEKASTWSSAHVMRTLQTIVKPGYDILADIAKESGKRISSDKLVRNYRAKYRGDELFISSAINYRNKQMKRYKHYLAEGKQTFSKYIVIKAQ